jgi:hypothetical protein
MSRRKKTTAAAASPSPPPPPPAEVRSRGVLRSILRWTWRVALVLVALVVLIRVTLPYLAPYFARKAGEPLGLDVRLDDLSLALLAGDIELRGLDVRPAEGQGMATDRPLFAVEYLAIDVAVTDLLDGIVRVRHVDIDGVAASVERRADGSLALPRDLEAKLAEPPAAVDEDETEEPAAEPEPYDFTLPVTVDRVTLKHFKLEARDGAVTPALERTLALELRLQHLGVPGRPFGFELRAAVPQLVDALRIVVDGAAEGAAAHVDLDFELAGIHLEPLIPYLEPLGITTAAHSLDFAFAAGVVLDSARKPPEELGLTFELERLQLLADLEESFALDRLLVAVPELGKRRIDVREILVAGLRGKARRLDDGRLRVAGLILDPAAAPAATPVATAATPEDLPADDLAASGPATPPPTVNLASLRLEDFRFALADDAASPPITIEPRLLSLDVRDVVIDENVAQQPIAVAIALAVPGLVERLDVAANTRVSGEIRDFGVELKAAGVRTVHLAPWLAPLGVEPLMADGGFTLATEGRMSPPLGAPRSLDLLVRGIRLTDRGGADGAEQEWLGLGALEIAGVELTAERIAIDAIRLHDPRAVVRREADGAIVAGGMRIRPRAPSAEEAASPPVAPVPSSPAVGEAATEAAETTETPAIALTSLTWKEARLRFEDEAVAEPRAFTLQGVDFALEGLELDAGGVKQPVKLRFAANVDGLVDHLGVDGEASALLAGSDVDAALVLGVDVAGIRLAALDPYLTGVPVDPTFAAADFRMRATANAKVTGGDVAAALEVRDIAFAGDGETLAGISRVTVRDAAVAQSGAIDVGAVEVEGVRLAARREADGTLIAAGVALAPPPAATAPPSTGAAPPEPPPAAENPMGAAPAAARSKVRLARLALDDVELGWRDAMVTPQVDTALGVRVALEDLELSDAPPPARFGIGLALAGSLEQLTFEGTVVPNPQDLALEANLAIRGLRPDAVAGYLAAAPPITLRDGRLDAVIVARAGVAAAGGQAATLAIRDFALRDGESEPSLAFTALDLQAPRIDAGNGIFEIGTIALAGLTVDVEKREDGELRLPGIALPPPAAPEEPLDAGVPGEAATTAELAAAAAPPVAQAAIAARPAPLLARIERFDVELARLRYVDPAQPAPLELALRLANRSPLVIDSDDSGDPPPPLEFELASRLDPLGTEVLLVMTAEPLAPEPSVKLDLHVTGIAQEQLAPFAPGLFAAGSPPRLVDGTFDGTVEARLLMRRRHALDFDVSHGFGGLLQVTDVELRESPDGTVLAGLDSLRASLKRMSPATGDIHLDSLEISTPRAVVVKNPAYLEVAGLRLAVPAPPVEGAAAQTSDAAPPPGDAATSPEPTELAAADPAPAAPLPEMKIDQILMSGIDVRFTDETVAPALIVPLDKLDVEVRNLTTKALTEPVAVRFDVRVGAGKVPMQKRPPPTSLVPGLVGGVGDRVGGLVGSVGGAVSDVGGAASKVGGKVTGAVGGAVGGALGALGFGGDEKAAEAPAPETAAAAAEPEPEPVPVTPETELEERVLFDELELKGQVAIYPVLKGHVDFRLTAFELLGVRSTANAAGVTISDGLIDVAVQTRLLGERGLAIDTVASLDSLSVSEPKDGPISRILQLPAPLDVVTFALRDEEGVLRIPLRVAMKPDDVSVSRLIGSVIVTLGEIIARAIARSPLRAVGTVTDVGGAAFGAVSGIGGAALDTVGLGNVSMPDVGLSSLGFGGEEKERAADLTPIEFGAGEATLDFADRETIARLAERLADDEESKLILRHRLVAADVLRAAELVNPNPEAIPELLVGLRAQRERLIAERSRLEAHARVTWVYGDRNAAASATAELRGLLSDLGLVEDSIDDLLDLTQQNVERRKDSRARVGALVVASERLAALRRAIVAAADAEGEDVTARIEILAPRFTIEEAETGAVLAEFRVVKG